MKREIGTETPFSLRSARPQSAREQTSTLLRTCAPKPAATHTTATCPDLVGELSTRSPEFGAWWAAHNVRYHQTGTKRLRHPVVGELELDYEVMHVAADDGLTITVYSAEPGSRSHQALDLLASWAATPVEGGAGAVGDEARPGLSPPA